MSEIPTTDTGENIHALLDKRKYHGYVAEFSQGEQFKLQFALVNDVDLSTGYDIQLFLRQFGFEPNPNEIHALNDAFLEASEYVRPESISGSEVLDHACRLRQGEAEAAAVRVQSGLRLHYINGLITSSFPRTPVTLEQLLEFTAEELDNIYPVYKELTPEECQSGLATASCSIVLLEADGISPEKLTLVFEENDGQTIKGFFMENFLQKHGFKSRDAEVVRFGLIKMIEANEMSISQVTPKLVLDAALHVREPAQQLLVYEEINYDVT